MKQLLVFSLLLASYAQAYEAAPPSLGDNIFESKTLARMLPVDEEADDLLNDANTAPTPIPEDTSLITAPKQDLIRQSQEESPQFDLEESVEEEQKSPDRAQ